MPSITLTVTPGIVFTSTTRLDAAALNLAATPVVTLTANGGIGPEYLDMAAIATATGDAATRNYLMKGSFSYEDWKLGSGLEVAAGTSGFNAQNWWARPTGGLVTVQRVEDSPGTASTWSAEIVAGTGLTTVDYYTWLPPAVGSGFRGGDVTFSLWARNMEGIDINARLFVDVASNTNDQATLGDPVNQTEGTVTLLPAGVWTRLQMTVDAADYEFQRGVAWGLRCADLGSGDALRVAEAQFEAASAATNFARPGPPPGSLAYLQRLTAAERILGGDIVLQLGDGNLRLLPPPPASILAPVLSYNRSLAIPEWIDSDDGLEIFEFTNGDQRLKVPAGLGITGMEVHCWGGGACFSNNRPGGVGGYSWGVFACTANDEFTVMVGAGGIFAAGARNYGFGGSPGAGGLSGLFSGIGPVLISDASRALLIAGGGGVSKYSAGSGAQAAGGNGNGVEAGGASDFGGGIDGTGSTPGGGGAAGGLYIENAGRGGTGLRRTSGSLGSSPYPTPISTSGSVDATARVTPVSPGQRLIVPGNTSPYYQNQAGQTGEPGLVVVKWIV